MTKLMSSKQFTIYMVVAFGLAWILEIVGSVFSNNGNTMVLGLFLAIAMYMPFLGVLIAGISLRGMGWVRHFTEREKICSLFNI